MAELLLDVVSERLLDLLRANAVRVHRVGDVARHRLDLHPVGALQETDHVVASCLVPLGHDVRARAHRLSHGTSSAVENS